MEALGNVLFTIFWSFLIAYVTTGAFNFFGVGINVYGVYLLWFMSLVMLSIFLPEKVGTIFTD
tara:strand:+ start:363 stop:551 length:189 start_codon:yes stop_codon:yes gene_type:complete